MKRWLFFIPILIMAALPSCYFDSFTSKDYIIDENNGLFSLNAPYIDEYGNEGIIAYVSDGNYFGDCIIAISADEGNELWGPMGEAVYKVDSINFDSLDNYYLIYHPAFGLMMLQSMKSIGINRFPAQQWCDKKNAEGSYPNASSWRLPNFYEMLLILNNDKLNDALISIGGTPLDENGYYWTCTEDIENFLILNDSTDNYDRENRAVPIIPSDSYDSNKDYWLKKNRYHVRAIKYVYYKN